MNNAKELDPIKISKRLSETELEVDKLVLVPFQPQIAEGFAEDLGLEKVVGVYTEELPYFGEYKDTVSVAPETSHSYTGGNFDVEYNWSVADDIVSSLEPQIRPERNLNSYEYPDEEERDRALERSISRIAATSDRLIREDQGIVIYNMDSIGRYELPELHEDPFENQLKYANIISEQLEEERFETSIHHEADQMKNVHAIGQRPGTSVEIF